MFYSVASQCWAPIKLFTRESRFILIFDWTNHRIPIVSITTSYLCLVIVSAVYVVHYLKQFYSYISLNRFALLNNPSQTMSLMRCGLTPSSSKQVDGVNFVQWKWKLSFASLFNLFKPSPWVLMYYPYLMLHTDRSDFCQLRYLCWLVKYFL